VVSEATLRLVPKPQGTLTALIHFRRLEEVGEAVPHLLSLRPSALEVMDANTLNLIGRSAHGIPADAAATLLAELDSSEGEGDLRERADQMAAICGRYQLCGDLDHRLRQGAARPTLESQKGPVSHALPVRSAQEADQLRGRRGRARHEDQRVDPLPGNLL
jgi:FAD/FMN-containing dehydrogenase